MLITEQESRINGLHIMEATLQISPVTFGPNNGSYILHATYALTEHTRRDPNDPSSETVIYTHGKCTAYPSNWSKATLALLHELVKSMERDLLPRHFKCDQPEEAPQEDFHEDVEKQI